MCYMLGAYTLREKNNNYTKHFHSFDGGLSTVMQCEYCYLYRNILCCRRLTLLFSWKDIAVFHFTYLVIYKNYYYTNILFCRN